MQNELIGSFVAMMRDNNQIPTAISQPEICDQCNQETLITYALLDTTRNIYDFDGSEMEDCLCYCMNCEYAGDITRLLG